MLEIGSARNGSPIARWGNLHLVSSFDPEREAARFAESTDLLRTVVLIGPVFGYLADAVGRFAPTARVVAIYLHPMLRADMVANEHSWDPTDHRSLREFLDSAIPDLDAAHLSLLEWPACSTAFPNESTRARRVVVEFMREAQASLMTLGAQGRLWMHNTIRNFPAIEPGALVRTNRRIYSAAVVAAAGPSLERSCPIIRRLRDQLYVAATGSALDALLAADVVPDIVVVTDAGPFAGEHLRALGSLNPPVPVAAPLSATRAIADQNRVIPLAQDAFFESELLASLDGRTMNVPSQGTVTASAIHLLRVIDQWPIVVAGLDCAWWHHRSHARPHISSVYRDCATSRTAPAATSVFQAMTAHTALEDGWSQDRPLSTYAGWFTRNARSRYSPLSIVCAAPPLRTLPELAIDDLARAGRGYRGVEVIPIARPTPAERRRAVSEAVGRLAASVLASVEALTARPGTPLPSVLVETGRRLAVSEVLRFLSDPTASRARELGDAVLREMAGLDEIIR